MNFNEWKKQRAFKSTKSYECLKCNYSFKYLTKLRRICDTCTQENKSYIDPLSWFGVKGSIGKSVRIEVKKRRR